MLMMDRDQAPAKLRERVLDAALQLILATGAANEDSADGNATAALGLNPFILRDLPIRTWAEYTLKMRRAREAKFSSQIFNDSAWDILLHVLISEIDARPLKVSQVCLVGGIRMTTGLRWIEKLEEEGLIRRVSDTFDRRISWVRLTAKGLQVMTEHFELEIETLTSLTKNTKSLAKGFAKKSSKSAIANKSI